MTGQRTSTYGDCRDKAQGNRDRERYREIERGGERER